jgi:hypothetical protein
MPAQGEISRPEATIQPKVMLSIQISGKARTPGLSLKNPFWEGTAAFETQGHCTPHLPAKLINPSSPNFLFPKTLLLFEN